LAALIYSGVTKGNSNHSSNTLCVAQYVYVFAPSPMGSDPAGTSSTNLLEVIPSTI
jgi:hypothetical protein